jgi:hypothetical protein
VVVDDIDAVIDALEQFRHGSDLADQLILARRPTPPAWSRSPVRWVERSAPWAEK